MTCIAAIDTDAGVLDLYEQLLADAGYDTLLYPDATTAYERLREAEPDAVILDLRLSTHNSGWAVLRSLREDARLCETPVIVCTADMRLVQQCAGDLQGVGCVVLAKPFDIDALLTALRREIGAAVRTRRALDAERRADQLKQRTEQHLQRAWARAMQAEERLAEASQLIAECYRARQREPRGGEADGALLVTVQEQQQQVTE